MIQHFIITVLVIYGIHASTRSGMILGGVNRLFFTLTMHKGIKAEKLNMIYKPLFDCTPCMASLYGTLSFFIIGFPMQGLVFLPVWVFSLCGFNYILNKILNK